MGSKHVLCCWTDGFDRILCQAVTHNTLPTGRRLSLCPPHSRTADALNAGPPLPLWTNSRQYKSKHQRGELDSIEDVPLRVAPGTAILSSKSCLARSDYLLDVSYQPKVHCTCRQRNGFHTNLQNPSKPTGASMDLTAGETALISGHG